VRLDEPGAARRARGPPRLPHAAAAARRPGASTGSKARTRGWDVAPTGRDDWHGRRIPGKRNFRALVYEIVCTLHEEMAMTVKVRRPG
jgi:hypothetical protein